MLSKNGEIEDNFKLCPYERRMKDKKEKKSIDYTK